MLGFLFVCFFWSWFIFSKIYCIVFFPLTEEFVVEPSSEKSRSSIGENDRQAGREGAESVSEDTEEEESTVEVGP
jgi:hypothetical protein